jgi:hypothetical protein
MSWRSFLIASATIVGLTVALTWPQVRYLGTTVAAHNDPFLSMWRLGWIAHALRADPRHLFDANIFHPLPKTLAYTDATFLEGIVAAPLLWAKLSPIGVYNVLLLAGFVSSGIGMLVLVHYLTRSEDAALIAAIVFTLAPYRIEHYMHLELQWTAWMPLAFWALHRAFQENSVRYGVLTGIFVVLQVLSSVYYGMFLAILLAIMAVPLMVANRRGAARGMAGLFAGGAILFVATWWYAHPYLEVSRSVGPRDVTDVARYSAQPLNYAASPPQNWMWGWTADSLGKNEARLFPGLTALVLAGFALRRPRLITWVYVAAVAAAVELSFGMNGHIYPWLYEHAWGLQALRAPARFGILAVAALAVLAGFGFDAIQKRLGNGTDPRPKRLLFASVACVAALEYSSLPMYLRTVPTRVPDVYQYIGTLGRSVVVELPMPEPGAIPGMDPLFMYWSMTDWNPLVNGYSGYIPREYVRTLEMMIDFPDDASIERLQGLGVRYLLVHKSFYSLEDYSSLMLRIADVPALKPLGRFRDWLGETQVFELKRN